jgi:acetyl esterase/lipase
MKVLPGALFVFQLCAQETILLHPETQRDPAAPAEQVQERGKNGVNDRSITNVNQPSVTVYLPNSSNATGTAIIICPGGGYQHLAIDKEGHDIARWLNTIGIAGIVLKYRLPGGPAMTRGGDLQAEAQGVHIAIEDAEAAIQVVRKNAARWSVKPTAVGLMGFSAGGHLAAMMGMVAPKESRPDFLVLGYPAIPPVLGITAETPRTFLVAADDDPAVNPAENAGRFFAALRAAKVPAELHIYSSGGHGFGMVKSGKTSEAWPTALVAWLKEAGLD